MCVCSAFRHTAHDDVVIAHITHTRLQERERFSFTRPFSFSHVSLARSLPLRFSPAVFGNQILLHPILLFFIIFFSLARSLTCSLSRSPYLIVCTFALYFCSFGILPRTFFGFFFFAISFIYLEDRWCIHNERERESNKLHFYVQKFSIIVYKCTSCPFYLACSKKNGRTAKPWTELSWSLNSLIKRVKVNDKVSFLM